MSIFDSLFHIKVSSPTPCPRNENEAICVILFACAYADGQLREAESDFVSRALVWKKWFYEGEISEYLLPVVTACKTSALESLIQSAGQMITERRRETVFALACDVLMSDGTVDKAELNVLELVGRALQLTPEEAKNILEVLFIKNLDNKLMIS